MSVISEASLGRSRSQLPLKLKQTNDRRDHLNDLSEDIQHRFHSYAINKESLCDCFLREFDHATSMSEKTSSTQEGTHYNCSF